MFLENSGRLGIFGGGGESGFGSDAALTFFQTNL
jgi:hypothetical protein